MTGPADVSIIGILESARADEKRQALIYRSAAASAEAADDGAQAQRFHDLHADEQHHLSRLTARVLELGGRPADLSAIRPDPLPMDDWKARVRSLEGVEIERYESILTVDLDSDTRSLIEEILSVEKHHASELGGKWTLA